ncbi:MAG: DNA polymerase III subunit delta [Steroidobacteraceae bacterium]
MKLTLENLSAQLAERLLPVYLVSGDEPLLVGEASDAIRARARARGFAEREVFFIERSSAVWDEVRQAALSLSLFTSRRIVEIRMPGGKPGVTGAAALLRLFEAAGEDLLVVIIADKLERETQASEWVQALQRRGAWLPIWPVERARLPEWLRARFAAAGLTANSDALALLAERSEGNLLAARQEIDKLAMLLPRGATVSVAEVAAGSADSARFDVFQLGEAVRSADATRALRILGGLRAEGAEPVLVLWSLVRELRAQQAAAPSDASVRAQGLPFARLAMRAGRADRMAKGLSAGDPWDELALLAVELTGLRSLPLVRAAEC